jgi:hypothetical protein
MTLDDEKQAGAGLIHFPRILFHWTWMHFDMIHDTVGTMLIRVVVVVAITVAFALPCSRSFLKTSYHKNRLSHTPLFRFEKDGRAGFINAGGKVVIPPKFDVGWFAEEDFVEGLSPARVGENWGFIDTKGSWVIEPKYWRVEPFSEGLAAVTGQLQGNDFPAAYIDRTGRSVIEFPKGVAAAEPFSEGLAAVRLHGYTSVGKLGYIDRTGTVVIPYQFALGGPFHDGLAAVVLDGQCYVEERNGEPRTTPPSVPAETSCGGVPNFVTEQCGEGFIDRSGKIAFRFQGVRDFSEGIAAVAEGGRWGFINRDGRFRIFPRFEAAGSFSGGFAAAKENGKWGYIDSTGQWAIQPQFSRADEFSDGVALTDAGYIDKSGTKVASATDGTAFVQGLAHVALGTGEYGYMNHLGKVIFRYRPKAVKPTMLPYSQR